MINFDNIQDKVWKTGRIEKRRHNILSVDQRSHNVANTQNYFFWNHK